MNNCLVLSDSIKNHCYRSILRNLVFYVHSRHYEKDAHFEDDFLLDLIPYDIYVWMEKNVYEILHPLQTTIQKKGRTPQPAYYKKLVLHFMSNKMSRWDMKPKQGNNTRS